MADEGSIILKVELDASSLGQEAEAIRKKLAEAGISDDVTAGTGKSKKSASDKLGDRVRSKLGVSSGAGMFGVMAGATAASVGIMSKFVSVMNELSTKIATFGGQSAASFGNYMNRRMTRAEYAVQRYQQKTQFQSGLAGMVPFVGGAFGAAVQGYRDWQFSQSSMPEEAQLSRSRASMLQQRGCLLYTSPSPRDPE